MTVLKFYNTALKLAMLGKSRSGKTTIVAMLAAMKAKATLIAMAIGDGGRTKITTEYWFRSDWFGDPDKDAELYGIELEWYGVVNIIRAIKRGDTFTQKESDEFKQVLKRLQLDDCGDRDPVEYLTEKCGSNGGIYMPEGISFEDLKFLITYGKIDKFIKKVIIMVPPAEKLPCDIVFRDTRGLLDLEVNDDKKITNVDISPSDIGLEGLDGVIMICSEDYEAGVEKLYEKLLKDVLAGVPIFFIKNRVDNLYEYYEDNYSTISIEEYINNIQDGKIAMFRKFEKKFLETYGFLNNFGVTEQINGEWRLTNNYFEDENKIKFMIPLCENLLDFSTDKTIKSAKFDALVERAANLNDEDDFIFCGKLISGIFEIIVGKLFRFMASVDKLFKASETKAMLIDLMNSYSNAINDELNKYAGNWKSWLIPRVSGWGQQEVIATINDITKYDVLGPRDGITTRYEGKYAYGPTLAVAIAAKRFMHEIVDSIKLSGKIKDDGGQDILPEMSLNAEEKLLKKAVSYVVYRNMADTDATFRGEMFINRYEIRKDIQSVQIQSNKIKRIIEQDIQSYFMSIISNLDYSKIIAIK